MAKRNKIFVCNNCGHKNSQWTGQCPNCKQWNTIEQEYEVKDIAKQPDVNINAKPVLFKEVLTTNDERIITSDEELNRVLGGGIVRGASILIGGEPGIGKSTLMLQLSLNFHDKTVMYVSGEESVSQIKLRANRLIDPLPENTYLYTETLCLSIINQLKKIKPDLLIIDSIQTLYSDQVDSYPGSVSQVRQCTIELTRFTKEHNISMILIGHINKEGQMAGPKIMEHMVDVVLLFEGDKNHVYRLLRGQKNRFGASTEVGIYEMEGSGLKQVQESSLIFTNNRFKKLSGNAIGITIEGVRPLTIEVQALVSSAIYGTPQRVVNGFDIRRLNMLLAVLEKRSNFSLSGKDVFVNVTGGFKIEDSAMDLAVLVAIVSSEINKVVPNDTVFVSEVGLSGELRPIINLEKRINEAKKLGFKKFVTSQTERKVNQDRIKVLCLEQISDFNFID